MGQHNLVGESGTYEKSLNHRPNQEHVDLKSTSVLCLVCKTPGAMFLGGGVNTQRVAKTMRRITTKKPGQPNVYVHETPCLNELVKNWAQYIVKGNPHVDAATKTKALLGGGPSGV